MLNTFKKHKNTICKTLAVVTALGATGLTSGCLGISSEGDRTGVVSKISYKGLITKSWEGELAMPNFSNKNGSESGNNTFPFSVLDENVRKQLQEAQNTGREVKIQYVEDRFRNCFTQESAYTAIKVTPIGAAPAAPIAKPGEKEQPTGSVSSTDNAKPETQKEAERPLSPEAKKVLGEVGKALLDLSKK